MLNLTALLFVVPAILALTNQRVFYAILLLFLTVSSIAWHSCDKLNPESMVLFWTDQVAIWSVLIMTVFFALSLSYQKGLLFTGLFAVGLLISIFLLLICEWEKEYVLPHSLLHIIAFLGFSCVI